MYRMLSDEMPPREGFIRPENLVLDWFKVPPAVLLSPTVPFYTGVVGRMKPPLGRGSSGNVAITVWDSGVVRVTVSLRSVT